MTVQVRNFTTVEPVLPLVQKDGAGLIVEVLP